MVIPAVTRTNPESVKAHAQAMYEILLWEYDRLMEDAEIFSQAKFTIELFDKIDAVLYGIRKGGETNGR